MPLFNKPRETKKGKTAAYNASCESVHLIGNFTACIQEQLPVTSPGCVGGCRGGEYEIV
jgi:hypothetical protein